MYIYIIYVHTILSYSHFALVSNLNSKWTILRDFFIGIGMAPKKIGASQDGFPNHGKQPFFHGDEHSFTLWLFNSLPWKDPPFLSSVNGVYHLFR